MRAFLALFAAAVLASCAPAAVSPTTPPEPQEELFVPHDQAPTAAQTAECRQRGGEFRRAGMAGSWLCMIPYADADKPCSDAGDCRGACLAPANQTPVAGQAPGRCAASNNPFGCFSRVEKGVVGPGLCVD